MVWFVAELSWQPPRHSKSLSVSQSTLSKKMAELLKPSRHLNSIYDRRKSAFDASTAFDLLGIFLFSVLFHLRPGYRIAGNLDA